MLLNSIEQYPEGMLRYSERYVNDGSPSGFTEIHRTSSQTDPFGITPWFNPFLLQDNSNRFETYGEIPTPSDLPVDDVSNWMLIHPDMVDHSDLLQIRSKIILADSIRVIPTASARTAQILQGGSKDYIKFHYDGIIGRINRGLPRVKAIAGPEVSGIILDALEKGDLPSDLSILYECGARTLCTQEHNTWGMVWRKHSPTGPKSEQMEYLVPYFSLFSTDRFRPYEPPLLHQILERRGAEKEIENIVLEELLHPILRVYFRLIGKLGLQFELNAQNILIGFDENWSCVSIVLRDMMGVEKDLTIRDMLGLSTHFHSAPYKCISVEDSKDQYQVRHSFVYDFKVGEYVFEPIIDLVFRVYDISQERMRANLRALARGYVSELPSGFFPQDRWYRHERVLLTDRREYIAMRDPKFR